MTRDSLPHGRERFDWFGLFILGLIVAELVIVFSVLEMGSPSR